MEQIDEADRHTLHRRRMKAILAAGLVLGIGAAVTLSAWNDSEFASGSFSSGSFGLEASTDGTNYGDHPSAAEAAGLSFSLGFDELSPNSTVVAPLAIRLNSGTTFDATLTVASTVSTGVGYGSLSYGIVQLGSWAACVPGASGTIIVPAGTALDSVAGASTVALARSVDIGSAPAASAYLCIQVSAGPALTQGVDVTNTWSFTAESSS